VEIDLATRHIGAEFRMGTTACATMRENKDYVSVREAAWRSSMSEKTIRNIIRNDALPHYRNGGFGKILLRWPDFVAWMERQRIQLMHDGHLLGILKKMGKARR
jgi:hypothetical protein